MVNKSSSCCKLSFHSRSASDSSSYELSVTEDDVGEDGRESISSNGSNGASKGGGSEESDGDDIWWDERVERWGGEGERVCWRGVVTCVVVSAGSAGGEALEGNDGVAKALKALDL